MTKFISFLLWGSLPLLTFGQAAKSGEVLYKMSFRNTTKTFQFVFSPQKGKLTNLDAGDTTAKDYYFSQGTTYSIGSKKGGEYLYETQTLGEGVSGVTKHPDTKVIAGYTCHKVTLQNMRGHEYTLWYTPDLPLKASPLPGLWTEGTVLAIDSELLTITASSVQLKEVKEEAVTLPPYAKKTDRASTAESKILRQ